MGFLDDVFDFAFGWLMPDPPKQLAPGAELTSAETDASIAKIYGKVQKKTGHIVFKEINDNDNDDYPNDLLHIIVVWGEAVESIDEVYIDDIPNSSNDDAFYAGDKRAVFVRDFPNGMGNYSDPILTRAGWRASDKLEGKACSYIRLEYHDDETAITSEPNLTADLTGTTHSNPATALLDYLTNNIYGKGLPSSYINSASFTYAKALCDSDVEEQLGSGVYRDLFSCNVALDTSAIVLENVNTLLKPMRGWLPIINGQLTLIIEEDNAPVDQPILEEDILQMGKITEGNKNNRFNRVSVTYYDPAADGSKQEAVYPEPDSELFEQMLAEDNGFLREESVDLKTCRNYYEALEFAKTYLEVSRQQTRTTITLPKWATIYDVGDVVAVTYMSGLPFWDAKLFRIESKEENREEVKLTIREHQPYIYDFFGLGNKPELPDTTYTNKTPDVPTDLNIEHIYDNFVQVKASWVSESQRFDYRVLKGDVIVQTERVASHSVEISGFDMGQYRFQVRALGGLGKRSGWAEMPLVMQVPSPPTSINLNISNFDIEVIPWLENAGSSVSFDYTITDENATEPGELIRGPAASYTFSGLSPITNYKIWVRSHNPLGVSDWVSVEATTHNDAEPITEIIEPILASITVNFDDLNLDIIDIGSDIDDLNLDIIDIGSDIDDINLDISNITDSITAISGINRDIEFRLKTESERRQQSELELLQSEIQAAASREELARRVAAGESLIDAVVYVDPTNGQIVNRAFNYTDESFTNAQLLIDGVSGEVDIATQRIETVNDEVTNLSSKLSLIPGQITATATSIVNESISALTPAHSFNFFDSTQGWIAVNGTIINGVNEVDVAFGDIENDSLNFDASENQLIRVGIERTAGSGWRGDVIIERDDTTTETYAGIIAEPSVGAVTVSADFRGISSYNGTINRVRLVLGDSVADEFTLTSIIIGKPDSSLLELEGVQARVSQAELDIDANEAAIKQRVTVTDYDDNTVTFSNVETTVDGLNSIIDLQATRQELIDNDTIVKANTAGIEINALDGTVTTLGQTVQSNQDNNTVQFIEANERIDAQNGEIVNNAYGIYTERARGQESDLAQLFAEIDIAKIRAGDLSTNTNFADAINKINIDIGPDGALAEQLTSLEAFTVINGNLITATNDRVDRVQTDVDGNAEAISSLNVNVDDLDAGLQANSLLLQSAELDADGNTKATAILNTRVDDVQTQANASTGIIQQSELDANGDTKATVAIKAQVNDPVSGLSATTMLAQSANVSANNAQAAADAAQADATDALNTLTNITDDGVVTPKEKVQLSREWQSIVDEQPEIVSEASFYSVVTTNYTNAYNQLSAYITPILADGSTSSNINAEQFNALFESYFKERALLYKNITQEIRALSDSNASAISVLGVDVNDLDTGLTATSTLAQSAKKSADNAQVDATSALNKLDDIANDGVITPQEKGSLNREWQSIVREYTQLTAEAFIYGIPDSVYDNAYNNLSAIVTPVFTDLTISSTIDAAQFSAAFNSYFQERSNLSELITDETKKLGDNNTTAINLLKAEVEDPVSGLNATASLAQQAITDTEGNASAITRIASGVTGEAGEAEALIKLDSYLSEGGLGARSFFGTNVNDQVTGIFVSGSNSQQQIEFKSDSVVFVDNSNTPMIYFDVENGRYVFDGEIIADSGTFSGNVSGATITASTITGGTISGASVSGGRVATTQSASASRAIMEDDGTYMFWIGEGAKNDANGTFWIKKDGTGYIKGSFFEGGIIESKSSTGVNSASVSHKSAGKNVNITVGSSGSAFASTTNAPPSPLGISYYTINYTVKRGSTVLESGKINVTRDVVYEENEFLTTDYYAFSSSLVDSNTNSATYTYTIEVDTLNLSNRNQKCSISTFENILS